MIEVISGTNRPGSSTLRMAKLVLSLYEAQGTAAQLLDLQALPPELFLPSAYGEKPASFVPLQDRILAAEGLHVVLPEYNGSYPGVLKYFIDMLKFPESFDAKPVAFTSVAAGLWGGLRPVEQLQMVFAYRNGHILPQRVFVPSIHKKWNEDGTFNDPAVLALLKDQAAKFPAFCKNLKRSG